MNEKTIERTQTIVLCIVIAFFIMISASANAQTNHQVDTVKYDYFDLKGRSVKSSFFAETNMGWRMWMLADDGIIRRKVWIDTIKK